MLIDVRSMSLNRSFPSPPQQPTFEDGEIELARPEMLSQDALVDNKHSLAVSLSLGNTLINLNKIKCPQCRKVSSRAILSDPALKSTPTHSRPVSTKIYASLLLSRAGEKRETKRNLFLTHTPSVVPSLLLLLCFFHEQTHPPSLNPSFPFYSRRGFISSRTQQ